MGSRASIVLASISIATGCWLADPPPPSEPDPSGLHIRPLIEPPRPPPAAAPEPAPPPAAAVTEPPPAEEEKKPSREMIDHRYTGDPCDLRSFADEEGNHPIAYRVISFAPGTFVPPFICPLTESSLQATGFVPIFEWSLGPPDPYELRESIQELHRRKAAPAAELEARLDRTRPEDRAALSSLRRDVYAAMMAGLPK